MAIQKPIIVRPLDLGTVTSGNERAGQEASNLNRLNSRGLTWTSSGNTNLFAKGQLAATEAIDFISVLRANAQPGTTIRVRLDTTEAGVDGTAAYDSGALAFINPSITREDGLYHSHLELPAIENASWWRIDIAGHTGDFQAAALILGEMVRPTYFYSNNWQRGVRDLGNIEVTRQGVFDQKPGLKFRTLDFALEWVTEAEYEDNFRPIVEAIGQTSPLYCCFDPEANTYRQARTYFGILSKASIARAARRPQHFTKEFSILSWI